MKNFRVAYVKKASDFDKYTHFGIRAEILFRGFSKSDILRIEQRIRLKIWEEIELSRKCGRICEVTMDKFDVKPFKDELIVRH